MSMQQVLNEFKKRQEAEDKAEKERIRLEAEKENNRIKGGGYIRAARKRLNISAVEIARALDVSNSFFWYVENGDRKLPIEMCDQVIEFFKAHGEDISELKRIVYLDHKAVSIKNLSTEHQELMIKLVESKLSNDKISQIISIIDAQ